MRRGISALYKSLKHHGLLKLPLVLPDASGENSGKDFLDALLEPAPGVLPLEGKAAGIGRTLPLHPP